MGRRWSVASEMLVMVAAASNAGCAWPALAEVAVWASGWRPTQASAMGWSFQIMRAAPSAAVCPARYACSRRMWLIASADRARDAVASSAPTADRTIDSDVVLLNRWLNSWMAASRYVSFFLPQSSGVPTGSLMLVGICFRLEWMLVLHKVCTGVFAACHDDRNLA